MLLTQGLDDRRNIWEVVGVDSREQVMFDLVVEATRDEPPEEGPMGVVVGGLDLVDGPALVLSRVRRRREREGGEGEGGRGKIVAQFRLRVELGEKKR